MKAAEVCLIGLLLLLESSAHVNGQVSPHDVLLTIDYGSAPGELDTTRIGDGPSRNLISSLRVDDNEKIWLLPRPAEGQRVLLCYQDGEFVQAIPFEGYSGDFLVSPEGVYSWGPSGKVGVVAYFAFDPGPGEGEVRRLELPESAGLNRELSGRLMVVSGMPTLMGLDTKLRRFSLNLEPQLSDSQLGSEDLTWGAVSTGGVIWQNTLLIMRDTTPILDLGLESGSLFWVSPDGSFIVRRAGIGDGLFPAFEIYDAQGTLQRNIVTFPRRYHFGVWGSPWFFKPPYLYQLVLGPTHGSVIRF
jgi:hypothetical protein